VNRNANRSANRTKWGVAGACAAVAAVVLYFTFFRASDEERIREVLTRFAKAVSVKQGDTVLSRGGRLKSELGEIVDSDVRVDVAELGIGVTGRPKLVEDATKAGLMYAEASAEMTGVTIQIDDAKTTAKADATAVVTATSGGDHKVDKRDVHFLLRKDGSWRITTIDAMAPRGD